MTPRQVIDSTCALLHGASQELNIIDLAKLAEALKKAIDRAVELAAERENTNG